MADIGLFIFRMGGAMSIFTGIVIVMFFVSLAKLKEINAGVKMILILCISDLVHSLKTIVDSLMIKDQESAFTLSYIGTYIYRWSLYWSVVIALFSYFVIVKKVLFDPNAFIRRALKYCCIIAGICPLQIACRLWGIEVHYIRPGVNSTDYPTTNFFHKIMYLLFYNGIGTLLPVVMIAYCYWKVMRTTKEEYELSDEESSKNNLKIFAYVAIPFICFVPGIIADTVFSFMGVDYPKWFTLVNFGIRKSWCVLNLLVYWFLGSSNQKTNPALANDDDNESQISRSSTIDYENIKDWE